MLNMGDFAAFLRQWVVKGQRKQIRIRKRAIALELDRLEQRELPASSWAFDFGTAASPVATSYIGVPVTTYSVAQQYGWQNTTYISATTRSTANALTTDFHSGGNGTFLADVPNGTYDVVATLGDAMAPHDRVSVFAEGKLLASS